MALQLLAVNYTAVLVASIVGMIIGYLWYGPLFGKTWAKLSGMKMDGKKKGMGSGMVAMFITTIVTVFVLAQFLGFAGAKTVMDAASVGILVWLGFFVTSALGIVLWEGKPFNLYLLKIAHDLVFFVVAAAILVSM